MAVRARLPRHNKLTALRSQWAPSVARRLLRHRALWVLTMLAISLVGSLLLSNRIAAADAAREEWGATQPVVVVLDTIAVGELLGDRVAVIDVPMAFAPSGALAKIPADGRAKVELHPDEILLRTRVFGTDGSAMAPGTVAMTVPVTAQIPILTDGSLVDLWAVDSTNFSSVRVAHDVVVIDYEDDELTVAVPIDQVEQLAAASLRPLTVALLG